MSLENWLSSGSLKCERRALANRERAKDERQVILCSLAVFSEAALNKCHADANSAKGREK